MPLAAARSEKPVVSTVPGRVVLGAAKATEAEKPENETLNSEHGPSELELLHTFLDGAKANEAEKPADETLDSEHGPSELELLRALRDLELFLLADDNALHNDEKGGEENRERPQGGGRGEVRTRGARRYWRRPLWPRGARLDPRQRLQMVRHAWPWPRVKRHLIDIEKSEEAPRTIEGGRVRLTGLVARPEFNGRCGTILGPGGTGGRWEVRLEGSAEGSPTVGVKDSNLEPLRTEE